MDGNFDSWMINSALYSLVKKLVMASSRYDLFAVVRRHQRMDGSSLTHFPFARTKWAMRRGFRPCMINPLARSTSPLDYGCDTEEYSIWIPLLWQNSLNTSAVKLKPLSVIMLWGTPNLWIILEMNFTAVSASAFVTGLAYSPSINQDSEICIYGFVISFNLLLSVVFVINIHACY